MARAEQLKILTRLILQNFHSLCCMTTSPPTLVNVLRNPENGGLGTLDAQRVLVHQTTYEQNDALYTFILTRVEAGALDFRQLVLVMETSGNENVAKYLRNKWTRDDDDDDGDNQVVAVSTIPNKPNTVWVKQKSVGIEIHGNATISGATTINLEGKKENI